MLQNDVCVCSTMILSGGPFSYKCRPVLHRTTEGTWSRSAVGTPHTLTLRSQQQSGWMSLTGGTPKRWQGQRKRGRDLLGLIGTLKAMTTGHITAMFLRFQCWI
jgi:hypothetical protein